MREMKDSENSFIGTIPQSWKVIPLKYVVKCNIDTLSESTPQEYEFDYIDIGSVTYGKEIEQYQRMCFKDAPSRARRIAHKDDVIISTVRTYLKAVASIPYNEYPIIVSTGFAVLKAGENVYAKYLKYLIQSDSFVSEIESKSYGVNYPAITATETIRTHIVLPNIDEQRRIADYLDAKCTEIDTLSADIQSEIDTILAYKQSAITEAVTKGLDKNAQMKDSGTDWLGNIPKHWDISRIGSVYNLRNTKVSDKDYEPLSVTMKGVVQQLDTAAKTNAHDDRKLVRKGDFVINSRSDRRGSCGISPLDGSVSLINTVLAPIGEMNPEYYNWLFHTVAFSDEFYKWGHGIVDDLWTTGWQEMKKILIPFPSLDEQKTIAEYLNNRCSQIDNVLQVKQEQLEVLTEYKKSLIYEYVTGKKEVCNVC